MIEKIDIEDLKEIDIIKNNLHIYIKDNSKKILDKNSIKFLKNEHEFVEKDMKQFLEKLRTTDFEGFDKLQEEIYQLLTKILNDNHIVFYKLFLEYCSMIFPYLFYYFNDLKVKEEDKKEHLIDLRVSLQYGEWGFDDVLNFRLPRRYNIKL